MKRSNIIAMSQRVETVQKTRETIKSFIKSYREQDNYATAFPFYFQIKDVDWQASYHKDDHDRLGVYDIHNSSHLGNFKTLYDIGIMLKRMERHEEIASLPDDFEPMDDFSVREACSDLSIDIYPQKKYWKQTGFFLRHEDAKRHLKANSHHYSSEAFIYCEHCWRSPELEEFLKAVSVLVDEPWQ